MATTAPKKQERLEVRMSAEAKELIEHAATLGGETVSAFANRVLVQQAEEIINFKHVVRLSAEDSLALVQALFEDPAPNENLKRAAIRYQKWVAENEIE